MAADLKAEICLGNNGSQIIRGNASALLTATDGGAVTWAAASQPLAGQKVLVGVVTNTGETITSVKDNGAIPVTFTLDATGTTSSGQFVQIWRGDSITLPSSGQYAVTVTGSGAKTVNAGGVAYSGVAAGPPVSAPAAVIGTSGTASTGTATPARAGALFAAASVIQITSAITINSGPTSGFTDQIVALNGAAYAPGVVLADKIDPAGPAATSTSWTFSSSGAWAGIVVVYDAAWTDISAYVYQRDTVTAQRGRPNEASTMSPAAATLTLNNRDARFTTRNPLGAYYPNLVQNTPLRLSVPVADAGLSNYLRFEGDLTSSATTPDKAGLQITGPIDIRVDCWPSDYQTSVLAAKWGVTAKSWMFVLDGTNHPDGTMAGYHDMASTGTLGFIWWTGSVANIVDSGVRIPYFGQRICLRVLFTPSTGTAQFFTAATMAGPFTQLGSNVVFGATTLANGSGQPVQVGGGPIVPGTSIAPVSASTMFTGLAGIVYEAQILNNVTLETDPVFSSQTAGTASFTDAQSSTWTLNGTGEISSRLYRHHGELSSFPKTSDPGVRDVYSQAAAAGVSQRLQNSNTPLNSPMYRAYVRLPASLNLAAYYPGEDGAGATSIGSAIGGPPMQFGFGAVQPGQNSDFVCSAPLPAMSGGQVIVPVTTPAGVTWTDNVVRFLYECPVAGEVNTAIIASFSATGAVGYVTLTYTTAASGTLTLNAYAAPGAGSLGSAALTAVNGQKFRLGIELTKNGSATNMSLSSIVAGSGGGILSGVASIAASPPGAITRMWFASAGVMGHWSAQGTWDDIGDVAGALAAWLGEPAATRVARLCSEEGIQARIIGPQLATMKMGVQTIDTLWNLLQACENTDLGMLFEPRQCLGIGYRTRTSMYHQSALATASFTASQIQQGFASTGDTQLTVNDVTASAPDGTTARQQLLTGAMSVQPPPAGIGRVATQISPAPQTDPLLNQIASWYLAVRSIDDDRYPAIPFQMVRASTPQAVALLDVGDFLKVTGTPAWLPPPPVSQLCAGFAETWFPAARWELDINGIPERPYETAQAGAAAGTAGNAKADTAGSQLTAGITSAAASFTVATTAGPVWTTAGINFPFDIVIDREQMTVSAISSATSPQTFTISARSVNGVTMAHSAGAAVALYRKPIASL
jgi:hypothetical protein